jgi:hypothetical protein
MKVVHPAGLPPANSPFEAEDDHNFTTDALPETKIEDGEWKMANPPWSILNPRFSIFASNWRVASESHRVLAG